MNCFPALVSIIVIAGSSAYGQSSLTWIKSNNGVSVIDLSKVDAKASLAIARHLGLSEEEIEASVSPLMHVQLDTDEFDRRESKIAYIEDVKSIEKIAFSEPSRIIFIAPNVKTDVSEYSFDQGTYSFRVRFAHNTPEEDKVWNPSSTTLSYSYGIDFYLHHPLGDKFSIPMKEEEARKFNDEIANGIKSSAVCIDPIVRGGSGGYMVECIVQELAIQSGSGKSLVLLRRKSGSKNPLIKMPFLTD
jgi:hypothetical protein